MWSSEAGKAVHSMAQQTDRFCIACIPYAGSLGPREQDTLQQGGNKHGHVVAAAVVAAWRSLALADDHQPDLVWIIHTMEDVLTLAHTERPSRRDVS